MRPSESYAAVRERDGSVAQLVTVQSLESFLMVDSGSRSVTIQILRYAG